MAELPGKEKDFVLVPHECGSDTLLGVLCLCNNIVINNDVCSFKPSALHINGGGKCGGWDLVAFLPDCRL